MADAAPPEIPPPLPEPATLQPEPSVKPELHPPEQKESAAPRIPLPPEPVVSVPEHVTVPSYGNFKRLDLTVVEEAKTEWTDEETLRLLEAILQYSDDWRMVSDHVGSRTEKECIARFIKLPIGEQYMQPLGLEDDCKDTETRHQSEAENKRESNGMISPTKRRRLTPLADARNPIMAQAAFLSALVGSDVASAAARAAVAALYVERSDPRGGEASLLQAEAADRNDGISKALDEASEQAHAELNKEEQDVEQYITNFIEVKLKGIQDIILRFEKQELQIEKEQMQLDYLKSLLR